MVFWCLWLFLPATGPESKTFQNSLFALRPASSWRTNCRSVVWLSQLFTPHSTIMYVCFLSNAGRNNCFFPPTAVGRVSSSCCVRYKRGSCFVNCRHLPSRFIVERHNGEMFDFVSAEQISRIEKLKWKSRMILCSNSTEYLMFTDPCIVI